MIHLRPPLDFDLAGERFTVLGVDPERGVSLMRVGHSLQAGAELGPDVADELARALRFRSLVQRDRFVKTFQGLTTTDAAVAVLGLVLRLLEAIDATQHGARHN